MVARTRGAEFMDDGSGDYQPETDDDGDIANEALEDVADWLGFAYADHYTQALPVEQRAIFKRAG